MLTNNSHLLEMADGGADVNASTPSADGGKTLFAPSQNIADLVLQYRYHVPSSCHYQCIETTANVW